MAGLSGSSIIIGHKEISRVDFFSVFFQAMGKIALARGTDKDTLVASYRNYREPKRLCFFRFAYRSARGLF